MMHEITSAISGGGLSYWKFIGLLDFQGVIVIGVLLVLINFCICKIEEKKPTLLISSEEKGK